ncbi:MAG: hypothetical protein JWQ56_3730 [Pseudarthrobacter sp.]|jgi:hypothetical protein|nr:hypothetical protein [Pseudarthrobacter sp.]
MALYPTIKPVSVNQLAVIVICPHCGSQETQRMQREGQEPIKPGDKVLFGSICSKTLDYNVRYWTPPNQFGYYIQFPTRRAIDANSR